MLTLNIGKLIYKLIYRALQKAYPEVGPLKNVNSTISLLLLNNSSFSKASSCSTEISLYIPKVTTRFWSAKQLEPFVKKLLNRDNFDGEPQKHLPLIIEINFFSNSFSIRCIQSFAGTRKCLSKAAAYPQRFRLLFK
jgi:hypothetical protein